MIDGEKVYSGELSVSSKMEDTSSFKLDSDNDDEELVRANTTDKTFIVALSLSLSLSQILLARKELRSTWHVSVYSPYWIINKTRLTLQYSVRVIHTYMHTYIHTHTHTHTHIHTVHVL